MKKQVKKYYRYLDLSYNATEEEVLTNQKAKIKILRAKAIKSGKSNKEKIDKIIECSNEVLENIKTNGVGVEHHWFESSGERVGSLAFTLLLMIIMFVASLVALL